MKFQLAAFSLSSAETQVRGKLPCLKVTEPAPATRHMLKHVQDALMEIESLFLSGLILCQLQCHDEETEKYKLNHASASGRQCHSA